MEIRVEKFIISSIERRSKQYFLDVDILPKNDGVFIFQSANDLQNFEDELRQAFEHICPFGCNVSSNINNQ